MKKKVLIIGLVTTFSLCMVCVTINVTCASTRKEGATVGALITQFEAGKITIEDLAWSKQNLEKFLANHEYVQAHIDNMNNNINLREFLATLENGHITNSDELLVAFRALQTSPPVVILSKWPSEALQIRNTY